MADLVTGDVTRRPVQNGLYVDLTPGPGNPYTIVAHNGATRVSIQNTGQQDVWASSAASSAEEEAFRIKNGDMIVFNWEQKDLNQITVNDSGQEPLTSKVYIVQEGI